MLGEVFAEPGVASGTAFAGTRMAAEILDGADFQRGQGLNHGRFRDLETVADDKAGAGFAAFREQ